ncbi:hypothetical protein TeGR_g4107 [Tetraparma gracilis]|uniref:Tubulin-tyrosine ligase n=1 Tax=Tetraparma gracilis TaxID=2962635 RepID=A0ABQ6MMW4_9STRA|nr:hypothetical protein TeGR_g4107 [Tetraparma gracilis]
MSASAPAPPSPAPPLLGPPLPPLHYTARSPWRWVFASLLPAPHVLRASSRSLPGNAGYAHNRQPATLSFTSGTPPSLASGEPALRAMCSSALLFPVDSKDLLVSTLSACCRRAGVPLSSVIPESILLPHDCAQVPALPSAPSVLKLPLGSCGDGVFFVSSRAAVAELLASNLANVKAAGPDLLASLPRRATPPSLVLQAEVPPHPHKRRFSLRAHVLLRSLPGGYRAWRHARTEVRLAAREHGGGGGRDRDAHITNGAGGKDTERTLLAEVPELARYEGAVAAFVGALFGRVLPFGLEERGGVEGGELRYALAGVDLMLDDVGRVVLLEVNSNPACAPREVVSGAFEEHLLGFGGDLLRKMAGPEEENPNWKEIEVVPPPQADDVEGTSP